VTDSIDLTHLKVSTVAFYPRGCVAPATLEAVIEIISPRDALIHPSRGNVSSRAVENYSLQTINGNGDAKPAGMVEVQCRMELAPGHS
jgi:hypothetical protein